MEIKTTKGNNLVYPKKKLAPIIEKYGINTNRAKNFKEIILLFEDSPSYYEWALKSVYSKECVMNDIKMFYSWAKENKHLIQHLEHKNLISYKSKKDFAFLKQEIKVLDLYPILKKTFEQFNTAQRNIVLNNLTLENFKAMYKTVPNRMNSIIELCKKFNDLTEKQKNVIIRKCSTLHVVETIEIINNVNNYINNPEIEWEKESFVDFIKTRCKKSEIVLSCDNYIVIEVGSFEDSVLLGKHTPWCISKISDGQSHWNNTIGENRVQYFLFNFDLDKQNDPNSSIGFTIENKSFVKFAHNNYGSGENIVSPEYKNLYDETENFFFDDIAANLNVDANIWIENKIDDIIKTIPKNHSIVWKEGVYTINDKSQEKVFLLNLPFLEKIYQDHNILLCKITDKTKFIETFGFVKNRTFNCEIDADTFVLFDMNEPITSINSIITWDVIQNEYLKHELIGYNIKDCKVNVGIFCKKYDIDMSLFLTEIKTDISLEFNYALKKGNLKKAWNIIENCEDLNVNTRYSNKTPIFMLANDIKDFELFKKVVSHPSFDISYLSDYGDTIFTYLVSTYFTSENKKMNKYLKNNIEYLLSQDIDFNVKAFDGMTFLMAASQNFMGSWIVKTLLTKPSVDKDLVNNKDENALDIALSMQATDECVVLLVNNGLKPTKENTIKELEINYNQFFAIKEVESKN